MPKKRILYSQVYVGGVSPKMLTGSSTWERLSPKLLPDEGKALVSADPDLKMETLKELMRYTKIDPDADYFYLGEEYDDSEEREVWKALISFCIKLNQRATRAELCAQCAALCRLPFLEIALILRRIEKEQGIYFYATDTFKRIRWYPRPARSNTIELKHKHEIEDDWDQLSTERTAGSDPILRSIHKAIPNSSTAKIVDLDKAAGAEV